MFSILKKRQDKENTEHHLNHPSIQREMRLAEDQLKQNQRVPLLKKPKMDPPTTSNPSTTQTPKSKTNKLCT